MWTNVNKSFLLSYLLCVDKKLAPTSEERTKWSDTMTGLLIKQQMSKGKTLKAWRTIAQHHFKKFQENPVPWKQNMHKRGVVQDFSTVFYFLLPRLNDFESVCFRSKISLKNNLLHSQGGRCKRQVSCLWWWLCWALGPVGWGLWRSFLCGKHRIPWRDGRETPPIGPAGPPQGQHTKQAKAHQVEQHTANEQKYYCNCQSSWEPTLAKLAVKRTHSNISPIFWRNSSTWGLFSTYTWNRDT